MKIELKVEKIETLTLRSGRRVPTLAATTGSDLAGPGKWPPGLHRSLVVDHLGLD
jgi:hypothetical protein